MVTWLTLNLHENPQKCDSEKLLTHAIIVRVTLITKLQIQNVSGYVHTLFKCHDSSATVF